MTLKLALFYLCLAVANAQPQFSVHDGHVRGIHRRVEDVTSKPVTSVEADTTYKAPTSGVIETTSNAAIPSQSAPTSKPPTSDEANTTSKLLTTNSTVPIAKSTPTVVRSTQPDSPTSEKPAKTTSTKPSTSNESIQSTEFTSSTQFTNPTQSTTTTTAPPPSTTPSTTTTSTEAPSTTKSVVTTAEPSTTTSTTHEHTTTEKTTTAIHTTSQRHTTTPRHTTPRHMTTNKHHTTTTPQPHPPPCDVGVILGDIIVIPEVVSGFIDNIGYDVSRLFQQIGYCINPFSKDIFLETRSVGFLRCNVLKIEEIVESIYFECIEFVEYLSSDILQIGEEILSCLF